MWEECEIHSASFTETFTPKNDFSVKYTIDKYFMLFTNILLVSIITENIVEIEVNFEETNFSQLFWRFLCQFYWYIFSLFSQ